MSYVPPVQKSKDVSQEIATNRDITRWFISMDPSEITLTPRQLVRTKTNAREAQDLTPRHQQVFKLVQGGLVRTSAEGLTETEDGTQRKFDYILIGNWDAIVEIGDWWEDNGQRYEVTGILPYNGYEVKAGIISHGDSPRHG